MELDSSIILFGDIRQNMTDNKNRIEALSRDLSRYMLVDPDMRPVFNTDYSDEIKAIRDEINSTRTENKNFSTFLELVSTTAAKYNISISKNQAGRAESCNLTGIIQQENQKLTALIAKAKQDFLDEIITSESLEKLTSEYRAKREKHISEVTKAQAELQKFIDSISGVR